MHSKRLLYILFLISAVSISSRSNSLQKATLNLELPPIAANDTAMNRYLEEIKNNEVIIPKVDTIPGPYVAVEQMPTFPGMQNGRPVDVYFTLPLKIHPK